MVICFFFLMSFPRQATTAGVYSLAASRMTNCGAVRHAQLAKGSASSDPAYRPLSTGGAVAFPLGVNVQGTCLPGGCVFDGLRCAARIGDDELRVCLFQMCPPGAGAFFRRGAWNVDCVTGAGEDVLRAAGGMREAKIRKVGGRLRVDPARPDDLLAVRSMPRTLLLLVGARLRHRHLSQGRAATRGGDLYVIFRDEGAVEGSPELVGIHADRKDIRNIQRRLIWSENLAHDDARADIRYFAAGVRRRN